MMGGNRLNVYRLGLLSAVLIMLFSIFAYAAEPDYTITYAGWAEIGKDGRAIATWERKDDSAASKTKYKVRLYRGSKAVGDWKTVSATQCEFSSQILEKGTGSYYFVVYPSKGGETMSVTSDTMDVDKTQKNKLKDYFAKLLTEIDQNFENGIASDGTRLPAGWQQNSGNWYYRQEDGKLKKSCWLLDKGKWYYLSTGGEMLTGWQAINSKWYFFGEDGALYVSTVTPDGSTVNENGEWVENGVVMTDERQKARKADASTVSVLSAFAVNLSEREETEGELYSVTIKNTSEAKVVSQSYSIPQEQWVPGQKVIITVTYEAYAGYAFSDTTLYTCSKATVLSHRGEDATVRTIELSYIPNLKLKTPDNFYLDTNNILRWDSSPHASAYEVRILSNGDSVARKTVESSIINLSDYITMDSLTLKVYAKPNSAEKSYITKSSMAVLEEITSPEGKSDLLVPGKITKNVDGSMTYQDENGNAVKNQWVKLAGNWYHFNASGLAENKGWYLDTDGHWYYFDDKHRMLVGPITVDGKKYTLNDGTRKDLPLGARY